MLALLASPTWALDCLTQGNCAPGQYSSNCDIVCYTLEWYCWSAFDCGAMYPPNGGCCSYSYDWYGRQRVDNHDLLDRALKPVLNAYCEAYGWCDSSWCQGCSASA